MEVAVHSGVEASFVAYEYASAMRKELLRTRQVECSNVSSRF
jgi:hypothetical protein